MWPDVLELRNWYQTLLGKLVRRTVRQEVSSLFPNGDTQECILGVGYCQPYLPLPTAKRHVFLATPAAMGGLLWPKGQKGVTLLCTEVLPFSENTFDVIFLSHCLEFTRDPEGLLEACWHALRPDGRLVVVVPNRSGVWARREKSIFSQGHPYSVTQLHQLLRRQNFNILETRYALFFPPVVLRSILRFYDVFERFGRQWRAPFSGVIITQARKDVFGMRVVRSYNKRLPSIVRVPAMGKQLKRR